MGKKKENGKKTETPVEVKQEKPAQVDPREVFFKKHETQIREHFSKDGAKVSELKKQMGFKDEKSYHLLLYCRDKVAKESK